MALSRLHINKEILAKLLHLPDNVHITAVRPEHGRDVVLEVWGPSEFAAADITANYTYQHTTIINFQEFEKL